MDSANQHLQQLTEIRSIMERSTQFLSLSGLSGVFIGVFALVGAGLAQWHLSTHMPGDLLDYTGASRWWPGSSTILFLVVDALIVLGLALITATYFTWRKAKRDGQKLFDPVALRLGFSMMIPLATGGLFCLILLNYHLAGLVAPVTLLFYGLALINGSKYTLPEIWWLGVSEVVLGLVACLMLGHALIFWAIGFGLLHIVYGLVMYYRYERPGSAQS